MRNIVWGMQLMMVIQNGYRVKIRKTGIEKIEIELFCVTHKYGDFY